MHYTWDVELLDRAHLIIDTRNHLETNQGALRRARHGEKSGPKWWGVGVVPSGCRLGPKLMNRCRLEKRDTKEHWKMLKIILKLEEEEVSASKAGGWRVNGKQ